MKAIKSFILATTLIAIILCVFVALKSQPLNRTEVTKAVSYENLSD